MLVKYHKQRFTVLLFLFSAGLIRIYILGSIHLAFSYIINLELLSISCNYITLRILLDKVSLRFRALVTFVSACVFMFARWYIKEDLNYFRFLWLLLSFVISINILVCSGSLLILLMGWDGLGISSFALIIYYESAERVRAGFLTLLINRVGDILIITLIFFYALVGSTLVCNYPQELLISMIWLFGVASLTKRAQYPFSAWLPAAIAAPTPVRALVHSSTLVTAGIYIMIRAGMSISIDETLRSLFLFCGRVTSLIGGLCAVQENDLKKIVAFSTLSQLGIIVFCLGLNSPSLALLHLYTHAMFKALLFLVAGFILIQSFGVQDIRLLGRITKNSRLLLVFLNTRTICLIGIPFLRAYYSKHAIVNLILISSLNFIAVVVIMIAIILSRVYIIRILKALNWRNSRNVVSRKPPYSVFNYTPCLLLFLGSLVLGWGFNIVDSEYLCGSFVPGAVSRAVDALLLVGIIIGLFFYKPVGILTLTNMFYIVPFWGSIGRTVNKAFKGLKSVEYGWAEPNSYIVPINNSLISLNNFLSWPRKTFSYGKYTLSLVSIILLCLYLK